MSRPDEGLIHQWLDGECTPEESARIEQLVATDAEWAAAVAEARGLIAASARIVGALDAVPRALPTGSPAAPTAPSGTHVARADARPGFRIAPWMGAAAALVLVAGTAYVLREQSAAPFGIVSSPPAPTTAMDTAPGVQIGRLGDRAQPPRDVPPTDAVRPATAAATEPVAGAGAAGVAAEVPPPAAPMVAPVPAPPPTARAEEDAEARRSAELAAEQERARAGRASTMAGDVSRASARQAPARAVAAPAAAPMVAAPRVLPVLDGCWRVSAPPELVQVLMMPPIRRAAGDTLVLITTAGDVTVVRAGDVLRGGLEAKQEPCRTP